MDGRGIYVVSYIVCSMFVSIVYTYYIMLLSVYICLCAFIVVFGAILSATDTVAVLGLLKNAGASAKLTYFIAGESLLNDGTALAMYNLLYRMIKINNIPYTSVEIVEYILKVIFLSPIIGICFGLGCLTLVSYFNHRMVRAVIC